jgi:DNA-directed RNA polymerase specialized sigma24 family protein
MLVGPLVECAEDGMKPEEIADAYAVPAETVRSLIAYARTHRVAPSPA